MRIGIDLDGVVYQFVEEFDRFMFEKNKDFILNPFDYNRGLDKEELESELQEFSKNKPFLWVKYYPLAVESIRELSKISDIYFVSYRDWVDGGLEETRLRLQMDEIPYKKLWITKYKGKVARQENLDFFVEDSLHNILDVISQSKSTQGYLINRPYNIGLKDSRIKRVNSLWEFFNEVK